MVIKSYLDGGKLIDAKVLSISTDDILAKFKKQSQNITALSLGSGYIIPPAAPHLVFKAFKNLASVGIAANYEFEQLATMKAAAAAAPAGGGGGGPAKEEKKEETKKEEDKKDAESSDDGPGDFMNFGGDDYGDDY